MKKNNNHLLTLGSLMFLLLFVSCSENRNPIPKPPTYLRVELPERVVNNYKDDCGFSFDVPEYFKVSPVDKTSCNRDVSLTELNGILHLSVINMDTSLSAYVNYAIDKVDEHKIKATGIQDYTIVSENGRFGGTLFELQGNVASPFQFYTTDSTNHFIGGVIYFNSRPNYDSLKPVLDFVKEDLSKLMETIDWE